MSTSDLEKLQLDLSRLNSSVSAIESKFNQQSGGCPVQHCAVAQCATPPPNVTTPLLRQGGGDCKPEILAKLGPLAGLIGTWVSSRTTGYNVMPLPEATAPNGFILKNFSYFEEITFSAIEGKVANRGGKDEQDAYTIFYEQRVFFSDGLQENQLVHAENGSWLNLVTTEQLQGQVGTIPIPSPPAPDPIPPQDPATAIVKQVSVPHGNSILALGNVQTTQGAPVIPDISALPIDAPAAFNAPYGSDIPTNPNVNPNIVLQSALAVSPPVVRTHTFTVDSDNSGGVENIPFIKDHINVSRFSQTMWLEELASGELQMQYTQNISLDFPQPKGKKIVFPHIVANTLRKL